MPSGGARPGSGRKRKGEEGTVRSQFTTEQIQELLDSPHVSFVSRTSIHYTKGFKDLVWQRYCDGVDPRQIFHEAGIRPNILGANRIKGLVDSLRAQRERGVDFSDGANPEASLPEKLFDMPPIPRRPKFSAQYSQDEFDKLTHKVKFLEQEVEFMKKIFLATTKGGSK